MKTVSWVCDVVSSSLDDMKAPATVLFAWLWTVRPISLYPSIDKHFLPFGSNSRLIIEADLSLFLLFLTFFGLQKLKVARHMRRLGEFELWVHDKKTCLWTLYFNCSDIFYYTCARLIDHIVKLACIWSQITSPRNMVTIWQWCIIKIKGTYSTWILADNQNYHIRFKFVNSWDN